MFDISQLVGSFRAEKQMDNLLHAKCRNNVVIYIYVESFS